MKTIMKILGNILWFLFGGALIGLIWFVVGLLWCVTIVGIPVGLQCFKMSGITFFPFGKEIVFDTKTSSVILNVFWLIFGGLELAFVYFSLSVAFCCTLIGIPFGIQAFKFVRLSLFPFGAEIKKI